MDLSMSSVAIAFKWSRGFLLVVLHTKKIDVQTFSHLHFCPEIMLTEYSRKRYFIITVRVLVLYVRRCIDSSIYYTVELVYQTKVLFQEIKLRNQTLYTQYSITCRIQTVIDYTRNQFGFRWNINLIPYTISCCKVHWYPSDNHP